MAWMIVPEPGTELGPCPTTKGGNGVTLSCAHEDCAESRAMAAATCRVCGRRIGYNVKCSGDHRESRAAHWVCALREADTPNGG
jgi:hypothetical protein